MLPKVGSKLYRKLNNDSRPIANKYHEGKVKCTLKRESKDCETIRREINAAEAVPHQAQEEADRSLGEGEDPMKGSGLRSLPFIHSALLRVAGQWQSPPALEAFYGRGGPALWRRGRTVLAPGSPENF